MFATIRTNSPAGDRHRDIRSERGYTLVELLVSVSMAIIVLGGIVIALDSSQQVEARDTEWALTLRAGRTGLARMIYEIRQATHFEKTEPGTIDFLAPIGSKSYQVKYECGVKQSAELYECVRFAAEEGKSLPTTGAPIVRDVLNHTSVFRYSPSTTSPTVVTVTLEMPAKGTLHQVGSEAYKDNVVLEDDAFLRNLDASG